MFIKNVSSSTNHKKTMGLRVSLAENVLPQISVLLLINPSMHLYLLLDGLIEDVLV